MFLKTTEQKNGRNNMSFFRGYMDIAQPKRYNKKEAGGALRYVINIDYNRETSECINLKRIPQLDLERIAEDEKYDGYYAIITSEVNMPDHEVARTYHGLWEIEQSFKITKSNLKSRPIYDNRLMIY